MVEFDNRIATPQRRRLSGAGALSREASAQRPKRYGDLRAVLLTAGILLRLPFTAWAQSPLPAHNGSCPFANLNGQHVQPAPECHLPPPLAQNPASVENTALALRQEVDRLGINLLRQSAASAEPKLDGSSTTRPLARPELEAE